MSEFRNAIHKLATAQKSSRGVSLYSRWINRPFGRVLAAAAHRAGLTPNVVTAASAACTGSALLLLILVPPAWWLGVVVGVLLVVGFALDSADGQLARLTGRSSLVGEWLDHVVDAAKLVCLHGAVLVAGHRFWAVAEPWLLVPLAFQVVAVVTFSALVLVELIPKARGSVGEARRGGPSMVRAVLLLPADYGILAVSFVLWGLPTVFLGWYALLALANLLILLALLVRWYRQLSRTAVPAAAGT
ncbi:CDP-alcohol phosphatidyltransferase family protein [Microlunatus sp. Y2014]|uniref:CDP-alcohol phosphatidyltransferase family protein n=1 Tax=Microlunatus sp. Y2014 TaxID=3418488 RepID=UPI003DA7668A